eukprot:gene43957-34796_t
MRCAFDKTLAAGVAADADPDGLNDDDDGAVLTLARGDGAKDAAGVHAPIELDPKG